MTPRHDHTGRHEHPVGSRPDCLGCREWRRRQPMADAQRHYLARAFTTGAVWAAALAWWWGRTGA